MRRILSVLLLPLPLLAQTAHQPHVQPGDEWRYNAHFLEPSAVANRTWVVKSVDPKVIEATENGEPLRLTRDLNVLESPQGSESNPRLLSFPLSVGKTWSFASDWHFKPKDSRGKYTTTVTVMAHEQVQVMAGEFKAFRLRAVRSLSGTSPINSVYAGDVTVTYWYAPATRAIVRSRTHNPYLGTSGVELVEYKLKP